MRVVLEETSSLRFDDGSPVRAASAIAPFGGGWLVAQDDATHAAWWRPGSITPVRVVAAVDGLEVFSSVAGTKHLKPDFEAAVPLVVDGAEAVLLLGSGSTPVRTRASLLRADAALTCTVAELTPLYHRVAAAIGLDVAHLNLEGACRLGDRLRWFHRGADTACVDVGLPALLAAVRDAGAIDDVPVGEVRRYPLGMVDGVALAVTDAVALADGRVLVSAAAEDTPHAIDDGPVVAAALVLLDDDRVLAVAELPPSADGPFKVEGLAVRAETDDGVRLVAVVDADDPVAASHHLALRVHW